MGTIKFYRFVIINYIKCFIFFVLFYSANIMLEESSKRNYVNVWEASTLPLMKMIGGINWKKNKRRSSNPVQEPTSMVDEGIDETDGYTYIKPGIEIIPVRREQQTNHPSEAQLDALRDGLAELVFSDQPIVPYNSQNRSQSENSVASLDG